MPPEEGLEGLAQGGLVGRGAAAADRTRPECLERVADVVLSSRDAELLPCVPKEDLEGTRPRVPGGGEALELGDVDAFVNVVVRSFAITAGIVRVLGAGVFPQAQPGTQGFLRDLDQTGKFLEREVRLILLVERHEKAPEPVRVGAALLLLGDAARVLQEEREQSSLELLVAGWRRRRHHLARTTDRAVERAQLRLDLLRPGVCARAAGAGGGQDLAMRRMRQAQRLEVPAGEHERPGQQGRRQRGGSGGLDAARHDWAEEQRQPCSAPELRP